MPHQVVIGLLAALGSALAYGSFAVPIKNRAVVVAQVRTEFWQAEPLLSVGRKKGRSATLISLNLQIHVVGNTGSLHLGHGRWAFGQLTEAPFATGIVAIISIHLAGLGVAQSTWSVVSVFVSFAWGKLYFNEPMASVPMSLVGLLLMMTGMIGLGYVASHASPQSQLLLPPQTVIVLDEETAPDSTYKDAHKAQEGIRESGEEEEDGSEGQQLVTCPCNSNPEDSSESPMAGSRVDKDSLVSKDCGEGEPLADDRASSSAHDMDLEREGKVEVIAVERAWHRHRFLLGVLGATYVGLCAGTMMVCLKLAPPDRKGDQYAMSFGIGVALVTLTALGSYFGGCFLLDRPPPSFEVQVASGPACLAGLLWSIANYFSIIATDSLGLAIGWPIVNCSLIVSNCWALFWYKEVSGHKQVAWFLGSSLIIIAGVFLLAWFGL